MSEGNLLDQQQHHQQQSQKSFCSSRDRELELLATTGQTPTPTRSSPEIRSRSQSVGSEARREALLFFEQHRLFQNSPELDFTKRQESDCELRSISSCSRNSSPYPNTVIQQVKILKKGSGLRQQSDSNLLDSDGKEEKHDLDRNGSGRARSQSQGHCGSLRKKEGRGGQDDDESSVIIINTTNKKNGESGTGVTQKQKASKWLQEIQFTAQYQHYRTNNYASVVSSASSLDKSDGCGGAGAGVTSSGDTNSKNKDASEAERSRSSSKPASSSSNNSSSSAGSQQQRHRHLSHGAKEGGGDNQNQEEAEGARLLIPEKDDLNRQNSITTEKCWNFPRVKLRKLFTAKSLDDILGGGGRQSSGSRGVGAGGSGSGGSGRKSLQVAQIIIGQDESSGGTSGISGERSSSSPEFVCRNTKKAQLLRDNKLSLPRIQQQEDGTQLLIVKPFNDGSKSPGAHSSKSAIVISTTSTHSPAAPSNKTKRVPTFIKATRQKSRSFSALTSALLSKVPGRSSSVSSTGCNSPCSSTTSNASGLSFFTKRAQHQDGKTNPPVVPTRRKSGGDKTGIVPSTKSDNCLNRFVASATCAKFVDYFSSSQDAPSQRSSKSGASTATLVEPFGSSKESDPLFPGTPSSSSGAVASASGQLQSISSSQVVTAQPRKWTAIKNKWDQKLQASGDRQKEIGASLASVSNNAQIFRKAHHQTRQRSNSLSPLDNPEDQKSIESLLEITSPSPTLQEVRFLDTPEIRYASPVAVRTSFYKPEYNIFRNKDDDDDDDDESEDLTEKVDSTSVAVSSTSSLKGSSSSIINKIVGGGSGASKDNTPISSRASSRCSSRCESCCSECGEEKGKLEEVEEEDDMTRRTGSGATGAVGGGTKRSRDHQHHHHHHHHHRKHQHSSASKEKPKLVVANVTYLQRPQSPGLVLRESSPCSSTTSTGMMDSFGNMISGSGTDGQALKNNNVFSNSNNNNQVPQPPQHSKSQQAKMEFLQSFSPSSTPAVGLQRKDPMMMMSAKNQPPSSLINANERRAGGGVGISMGSGAGGSFPHGALSSSSNYSSLGANSGIGAGRHQTQMHDDLQRRERGVRVVTFDPLGPRTFDEDNEDPSSSSARRRNRSSGAEQNSCSALGNQNQLSSDFSSSPHERQAYARQGARVRFSPTIETQQRGNSSSAEGQRHTRSQKDEGKRSSDNQSSDRDPGGGADNQSRLSREEPSFPINQGQRPAALAQQSSLNNNNLFIDVDFEGTEDADDAMGDLQSPQYVKRTAHMFDSRFSTEHGANGHERNGRNPSYLNVSRSVSGYSCLAYNNGSVTSETVTNKSVLGNGASLLTSSNRVSTTTPRLKTDFSLQSPFSRSNKVPNTDDDSSDHSSNQSATSPPPSLPPINTTSARFSDSPYFQNGMSRVVGGPDDLMEDTPYIPSHGKSFIMQRIERLYGSDAVQNKQILGRKSSNPSSHVTTISISRESPPRSGKEHIIPIKVEPRDDHQNNLYNNKKIDISKKGDEHVIPISLSEDSKVTLPGIRNTNVTNEENVRRIPIETRRSSSRVEVEDSDEDLEEPMKARRARSKSPTKNLNGNANRYRNGVTASSPPTSQNGKLTTVKRNIASTIDRPTSDANGSLLEHVNGNDNKHIIELEEEALKDCTTTMKKSLSRESSAESDDTNNSLELASIGSDENSKSLSRRDSQDNNLYSNRGSTSPVKPKPKPKPKDMALLRTLSRSPASLKTGLDSNDKTASISLNIIEPETTVTKLEFSEDQVDRSENNSMALSNIKNTELAAPLKEEKPSTPTPSSIDKEKEAANKENKPEQTVQSKAATTPVVKDGNYFKNEMNKVKEEILKLSEKAAKELDTLDSSEDRAGSIHAAIGKGNLLVKKKFKQFDGLCDANLKGVASDEPETTNEDLAGFWDMVMIQVEQIYSLFADLENKDQLETPPKTPTKSSTPKRIPANTSKATPRVGATPKLNSEAAKARDEARRKLLAEKRRAMKSQMQQEQQEVPTEGSQEAEVQIFTPDSAPQTG